MGSIENWKEWDIDWDSIDIIIGGSPCQYFSIANVKSMTGKMKLEDSESNLFFTFMEIIKKYNKFFVLENVIMKQEYITMISNELGFTPMLLNSQYLSSQSRKRLFWIGKIKNYYYIPSIPKNEIKFKFDFNENNYYYINHYSRIKEALKNTANIKNGLLRIATYHTSNSTKISNSTFYFQNKNKIGTITKQNNSIGIGSYLVKVNDDFRS